MFLHILNILKMGFGMILVFLAILLWSRFKRFTSGVLAVTSLLLYASILFELLEHYKIFDINRFLIYKDIPIVRYIISLLTLISFIVTLIVFLKEEKE